MTLKLPIAAAAILATITLTNAMDNPISQEHHFSISGQTNPFRVLPNEILLQHFILECPVKNRILMRGVDKFTRNAIDKAHEGGKYLEELVYELAIHNKIYMEFFKADEPEYFEGEATNCVSRFKPVTKLPQNIRELRDWCAMGYPFAKGESVNWDNQGYGTKYYSFWLFHYGVQSNCLPLVRYALDQHNNFWDPQTKWKHELSTPNSETFYTHLTYIVGMDFVDIFDFVIHHDGFFKFSFGDYLLSICNHGNKPIKTKNLFYIINHGSKDIMTLCSHNPHFINMCLNVDKPNGEGKVDLVELATKLGRPQEIINIIASAVENTKETTIETEL